MTSIKQLLMQQVEIVQPRAVGARYVPAKKAGLKEALPEKPQRGRPRKNAKSV
jgi:hypothetical protein